MNMLLIITVITLLAVAAGFVAVLAAVKANIGRLARDMALNQQSTAEKQNISLAEQNEKLAQINRQLNDTMSQVSRSIGEMNNITSGVDDLKRLMTNVKSRGIMGELQLGAILEDVLAPGQYEANAAVTGTNERVEFAVKFPAEDGNAVYLPIDSKFPGDAYLNLLDAYDTGDRELIKRAAKELKYAIIKAAKDIKTKYIYPPKTTEYAVMFLPFEGLYAEVLRMNIIEVLQNEYRVNVAGPTTMAAMLSSFSMGFKSLALQQSSGEVWNTLEKVKTEFEKFSDVLTKVQKNLETSQTELEKLVGVRTRTIQKELNKAAELSGTDNQNKELFQ